MSDPLRRARWALAAVVALLVVGCGDDDDQPAAPAAQAPIARSAVLQPTDLPQGWTAGAVPADTSPSTCDAVKRARSTTVARARSRDFTRGELQQASHVVYLYDDVEAAQKAFGELGSEETRECLAEGVGASVKASSTNEELEVGAASATALTIDKAGDDSTGARVTLPLSTKGIDVPLNADLVLVRVGRGLSLLTLLQVGGTFPDDLRTDLEAKGARRLQGALEAA